MLQNNPELKSKIDELFWIGGISNPLTAIEWITYLLFMKRLDELDQKKQADDRIRKCFVVPRAEIEDDMVMSGVGPGQSVEMIE